MTHPTLSDSFTSGPRTLETTCPEDGDVTAELRGNVFRCPDCGEPIPRRIIESPPDRSR